jgi:hypothetical protein
MKKLAGVLIAITLAASGAQVDAAENWHQDYVRSVYPLSNGDFVVTFTTSPAACLHDSNPKYFFVRVGINGVTSEGVKAMLATALSAFTAGKRLSVAFNDASSTCDINRMSVSD